MNAVTFAVVASTAVAVSGCASYASRATARPAPVGVTKIAIAADAVVYEHGRRYTALPAPELSVRRGMTRRWDLGARVGVGSAEAAATVLVIDSPRSAVAIVPNLGVGFAVVTNNGTDVLRVHAGGRVVWERELTARVSLATSLGARITGVGPPTIFGGEAGEARVLIEPSTSVGVRIERGRRVIWPEVGLVLPIDPTSGTERPAVQLGIAVEL